MSQIALEQYRVVKEYKGVSLKTPVTTRTFREGDIIQGMPYSANLKVVEKEAPEGTVNAIIAEGAYIIPMENVVKYIGGKKPEKKKETTGQAVETSAKEVAQKIGKSHIVGASIGAALGIGGAVWLRKPIWMWGLLGLMCGVVVTSSSSYFGKNEAV